MEHVKGRYRRQPQRSPQQDHANQPTPRNGLVFQDLDPQPQGCRGQDRDHDPAAVVAGKQGLETRKRGQTPRQERPQRISAPPQFVADHVIVTLTGVNARDDPLVEPEIALLDRRDVINEILCAGSNMDAIGHEGEQQSQEHTRRYGRNAVETTRRGMHHTLSVSSISLSTATWRRSRGRARAGPPPILVAEQIADMPQVAQPLGE